MPGLSELVAEVMLEHERREDQPQGLLKRRGWHRRPQPKTNLITEAIERVKAKRELVNRGTSDAAQRHAKRNQCGQY